MYTVVRNSVYYCVTSTLLTGLPLCSAELTTETVNLKYLPLNNSMNVNLGNLLKCLRAIVRLQT